MRVLHLSKFYPPDHYGGVETVCKDLCEGLSFSAIDFTIICHTFKRKKSIKKLNGINVISCPTNFSIGSFHFSLSYIFEYIKIYKKFDIVHVHCPNPLAFISMTLLPFPQRLVLHWHSDVIKQKYLYIFFKYLEKYIIFNAYFVIGATERHVKNSNQYNLFYNKYKVIPYAINFNYLKNHPLFPKSCKNFPNDTKFIFTLGRHVSYKGFDVLIKCLPKINSDICLVIGGIGPDYKMHVNLVKELNLSNRVFFTGRLSLNEIIYFYSNCLFFCLPSLSKAEMFGVVQLEAMYFGKPVVSCDIEGSGVPCVNLNNITGLTTKPKCPSALADAINFMSSDHNYLRYSSNIKKHLKNYDYQMCLNLHLSLYKKLLS